MCGIFGYVGGDTSFNSLVEGLSRLEYRGYDSCGLAAVNRGKLFIKKRSGKIAELKKEIKEKIKGKTNLCILHTRWATHGRPNKKNAHPHFSTDKKIALVHNGIIENFLPLKEKLKKQGCKFRSETDSEVIIHLIEKYYKGSIKEALLKTIKKIEGSFALALVCVDSPEELVVARKSSPLIIGLGGKNNYVASDMPALLPFTKKAIYLKDQEVAVLKKGNVQIYNFENKKVNPTPEKIKMKIQEAGKNGYDHFMLKEIFEQPAVMKKIFSLYSKGNSIHFPQFNLNTAYLKNLKKIYITACGTAYHAGYVTKYFLEKHCGLDVEIDTSSEFRYRNLNLAKNSLIVAISQSGETADTLASVREGKKAGAKILSICNVLGSSLVKESDAVIAILAGPEIGVASTKAYTAQVLCLYLFALNLARIKKTMKTADYTHFLKDLKRLPQHLKKIFNNTGEIKKIAKTFSKFGSFLFLGRGINYPSALEGALKLKEISYIPAEGYPAGEMKHGPIALIDEYRGVVCITPQDELYEKMVSNIQEVKARKGKILAILNEGDREAASLSDKTIHLPSVANQELNPFLVAVSLQLFAYYVARNLGCEIDQPRNLAKSVTVE